MANKLFELAQKAAKENKKKKKIATTSGAKATAVATSQNKQHTSNKFDPGRKTETSNFIGSVVLGSKDGIVGMVGDTNLRNSNKNAGTTHTPGSGRRHGYTPSNKDTLKKVHTEHQETAQKSVKELGAILEKDAIKREEYKKGLGPIGKMAMDVAYTGGQMATDIVAGTLLTGGAGGAIGGIGRGGRIIGELVGRGGITKTIASTRADFQEYNKAISEGASDLEARAAGLSVAALEYLTESLFGVGSAIKSTMGRGLFDAEKLLKLGTKDVIKSTGGRAVAQSMAQLGLTSGTEGAEEFISGMVQPILERMIYSDEKLDLGEMLKSSFYQAAIGTVLGSGFGAVDVVNTANSGKFLSDPDTIEAMVDEGLNSKENTKAYKLATQMVARKNKGIQPTSLELSQLHRENIKAIQEEQQQDEKTKAVTDKAIERNVGKEYIVDVKDIDGVSEYYKEAQQGGADLDVPVTINEYAKIKDSVSRTMSEKLKSSNVPGTGEAEVQSISRILIGQGDSRDFTRLYPANQIAREVFEQETGQTLPDTNAETREYLLNYNENMRVAAANMEKNPSSLYVRDNAINAFRRAGEMGLPMDSVTAKYGTILTEQEQARAYESGKNKPVETESKPTNHKPIKNRSTVRTQSDFGFVDETSTKQKTDKDDALDKFAKMFKLKIVRRDSIKTADGKAANGYYEDGAIVLSKNSTLPMETVFAHELWHHLKKVSPKKAKELESYVKKMFFDDDAIKFDNEMKRLGKLYGSKDDDFLFEEFMSDHIIELLSDPKLAQQLATENKGLAQAILDFINQFIESIKSIFGEAKTGDFYAQLGIKEEAVQMLADTIKAIDTNENTMAEQTEPKFSKSIPNKKQTKSQESFNRVRIQFPQLLNNLDFDTIINQGGNLVNNKSNKDTRFSLSDPMEAKGGLIAVHNLSEESLKEALNLGGFPMPSIAIVTPEVGHDNFGPVSVILGKSSVDPKNPANRVYSGDAWTPTFPQVGYKFDEDKLYYIAKKLTGPGYFGEHGNGDPYRIRTRLDVDNVKDRVSNDATTVFDAVKNEDGIMAAFLIENGIPYEQVYRNKTYVEEPRVMDAVIKKYGMDTIKSWQRMSYDEIVGKGLISDLMNTLNEEWAKVMEDIKPGSSRNPFYNADNFGFGKFDTITRGIKEYYEDDTRKELDTYKTSDNIKAAIEKHRDEYNAWGEKLFAGTIVKKGIRNEKDMFTPSGNRRSFESMYFDYTLENIVKAMKSEPENGNQAFGVTAGFLKGKLAKRFKSVQEIKDNIKMLNNDDVVEQAYDELNDSIMDIIHRMTDKYIKNHPNENSFMVSDTAASILIEAAESNRTPASIKRVFDQYDYQISYTNDLIDDVVALFNATIDLPVRLFESKPRRAVGIEEIQLVVLPNNTDKSLVSDLESRNIPIDFYDKNKAGDRIEKVNSHPEVRWSLQDTDTPQGMDYTVAEIKDMVRDYFDNTMYGEGISVVDIDVYGSRTKGLAKETSDMDVIVEYSGNMREDDVFNALNEDPLYIDGIQVDINPITKGKSGTMDEYRARLQRYSLQDSEYMDAVNKGNIKKAEKLVESAVSEMPNVLYDRKMVKGESKKIPTKVWHYSRTGGGFDTFNTPAWFSRNPEYANTNLKKGLGYSELSKDSKPFYLVAKKIFGIPSMFGKEAYPGNKFIQEHPFFDGVLQPDELYTAKKMVETPEIVDTLMANGYDTVWAKQNGYDIYVVFNSNQIKSADAVTYDENGKVIPLSERFNVDQTDIRYSLDSEGNKLTPEQIEFFKDSQARNESGKLLVMYHGTSGEFDVFDTNPKQRSNYREGVGNGTWFTDSFENAKSYSYNQGTKNATIKVVYLKAETPIIVDFNDITSVEKILQENGIRKSFTPTEWEYRKKKAIQTENGIEKLLYGQTVQSEFFARIHSIMANGEYDSLILKNYNDSIKSTQIVVFRPTQIKAVDNLFPTDNDDIRYSLDSESNKLTPEQVEYFKDSKVRDKLGRLLKVYHGTGLDFTAFDIHRSGENFDRAKGGIYFTDDYDSANIYAEIGADEEGRDDSGIIINAYLNIKNPLTLTAPTGTDSIVHFDDNAWDIMRNTKGNGHDGVIVYGKSRNLYIAFKPEQIKSVDNKKPTNDDDIRYQLQEQADTDKLRIRNKIQELQTMLSEEHITEKGLMPDAKSREVLVRKLRADYNSEIKPSELVAGLNEIYALLKSGKKNLEKVYEISHELAKAIVSQGGVLKNETERDYQALKEYMRKTPIKIDDEYKGDFGKGDWNRFRKSMFGRLNLTDQGEGIDTLYKHEILPLFPGHLNADLTHPTEILNHILDVMEELEPVFDNYDIRSESGREMVDMVTLDILDAMFEIDPQKPLSANQRRNKYQSILESIDKATGEYANKTAQQLQDEKAKYQAMLSELETSEANRRLMQKQRYETLVEELKQERDEQVKLTKLIGEEKLKKQDELFRKRLEKTKARFYEQRTKGELMDSIKRNADYLAEALVHPTDNKHIPEGYQRAVAEVLNGLDFESTHTDAWEKRMGTPGKRVMRLRKLAQQYEAILDGKEESFAEFDEEMRPLIRELSDTLDSEEGGRRLSQLNNDELNTVRIILKHLRHVISTSNRAFNDRIKETYSELGESIINEMSTSKIKKEYSGMLGSVDQFFNEQVIAPTDFFAIAGGTLNRLFYEVRKGFDKHINNVTDAMSYIDSAMEGINKKDAKKWSEGFGKATTFTLSDGNEIKLIPAQVMSLYALNKREQARGHIFGSGIVVAPLSVKEKGLKEKLAKTHRMVTEKDVQMIISSLSDEQKQLANKLLRFISTTTSEWGNETSLKLYGIRKYTEDNYFPIKSDKAFLMEQFEVKGDPKLKNMGFTKNTVDLANNPIVIDDFFNVITNHITQMSMYNALVPALTDFERVYNYTQKSDGRQTNSVKNSIQGTMGQKGIAYISRFMQNVNGSYNREYGIEWAEKLLSGFKKSALGLNMRVLVQQPTSLIRASMVIDHSYLLEGMAQKTIGHATRKEMWDHVPIARWKSWGYAQTDVSREQRDIMLGNTNMMDTITMGAYGFADDISWTVLYAAVKAETKDKYPELQFDTPEYWEHIVDRFNEIVDRTQVVDSVFHRTEIMRDKTFFKKTLTSFMPEPLKLYNMVRTQLILANKFRLEGNATESAKAYSRIATSLIPYFAVLTTVQAIMDTIRRSWTGGDDDDDKSYLELFKINFWDNLIDNVNPMNMLPFFRDVWSSISGYDVKRPDMAILTNMADDVKRLVTYFDPDKESPYTLAYISRKLSEDMVSFAGIPLKNLTRELESATFGIMSAMGYTQAAIYFRNKLKFKVLEKKNENIDLYLKAELLGDPKDARMIYDDLKKEGITEKDITDRIKYTYGKEFRDSLKNGLFTSAEASIDKMISAGVAREDLVDSVRNSVGDFYKEAFAAGNTDELDKYDEVLAKVGFTETDLANYRYGYAKGYAKYQVYKVLQESGESAAYDEAVKWVNEYPGIYESADSLMYGIDRSADSTKSDWDEGKWRKDSYDKFE